MSNSTVRASVITTSPTALSGPALVLVDGSETPLTANGLAGYTPTPGDRLLVTTVGSQVEILQFLSRGVPPDVGTYNGPVDPANIQDGILSAAMSIAPVVPDPALGPTTTTLTPPSIGPNGELLGGFVITDALNPSGEPLIRLHPAGSIFNGKLTAQILAVMQDMRINGAGHLSSAASLNLENGVATPPAPIMSTGLVITTWPAVPSGYLEKGICWDAEANQWWQVLWKTGNSRVYVRSIGTTGIATTVQLVANPADVGETLSIPNGLAYSPQTHLLYTWMRFAQSGSASPQWRLYSVDGYNGTVSPVDLTGKSTIFDTSPAATYPGVAVDSTTSSNILYWSMNPTSTTVPFTRKDLTTNALSYAKVTSTGITDVANQRSLLVSSFDQGTPLVQVGTRSGNVYHFTYAAFNALVGSATLLARDSAKDFLADNSSANLSYNNTAQTVVGRQLTSNLTNIFMRGNHGLFVGDTVTVSGVGAPFDGTFPVSAISGGTTFQYAVTNADIGYSASGGRVTSVQARKLIDDGFYSSKSDAKIARYSSYFPSAGEKWWAQYIDTGAGGIQTDVSPESVGLTVAARRFVTATLRAVQSGVTGASVFVGYGTTTPGNTKYKRAEAVANRAMVMTNLKDITGVPAISAVTNKVATTTVATLTTAIAHGLVAGEKVTVMIGDATFDGVWTLSTASGTTLTYARLGSVVASTGVTGTIAPYNSLGGSPSVLNDTIVYTVTNKSRTTTTAVLTIGAHIFRVGQVVAVSIADAAFDTAAATITAITATTFSYTTATSGTVASTPTVGTATGSKNYWRGDGTVDLPGLVQLKKFNTGKITGVTLTDTATSVTTASTPHGCTGVPVVIGTSGPDGFASPNTSVRLASVDGTNFTLRIVGAAAFTGQVRDFSWIAMVPQ